MKRQVCSNVQTRCTPRWDTPPSFSDDLSSLENLALCFSDEVYPKMRWTPPVFQMTCPHVELGPLFFRWGVPSDKMSCNCPCTCATTHEFQQQQQLYIAIIIIKRWIIQKYETISVDVSVCCCCCCCAIFLFFICYCGCTMADEQ